MSHLSILIAGSVAFDTLMQFEGHFHERFASHDLTRLSTCFLISQLRREFGGCGGNIAFSLRQLGDKADLFAAVGGDFAPYEAHLKAHDMDTSHLLKLEECWTAQCFVTSDLSGNQLSNFHAGALARTQEIDLKQWLIEKSYDLAIVSPSGRDANILFCEALAEAGVPYLFDIGQELPLLTRDEFLRCAKFAKGLILNSFERDLLCEKLGQPLASLWDVTQLEFMLVTQGAQEIQWQSRDASLSILPPNVASPCDPTGCGDAFRAGILFGLVRHWEWSAILELGAILGAIKVETVGTQRHCCDLETVHARWREAYPERQNSATLLGL